MKNDLPGKKVKRLIRVNFLMVGIMSSIIMLSSCNASKEENSKDQLLSYSENYESVVETNEEKIIIKETDIQSLVEEVSEREEQEETEDLVKSAYQKIIDEYVSAFEKGYDFVYENQDQYENINHLAIALLSSRNTPVYYAFYDIDKNGVDELLFSVEDTEEGYHVFDVFTYNGLTAHKLFWDDTLIKRSSLSIYSDGTMYIYGSGGAAYGSATFYQISEDGYSEKVIENYTADWEKYPDTPYYNDNEMLRADEFNEKLAGYTEFEDETLEWKAILG